MKTRLTSGEAFVAVSVFFWILVLGIFLFQGFKLYDLIQWILIFTIIESVICLLVIGFHETEACRSDKWVQFTTRKEREEMIIHD